jgi:hypothetical protein
MAPSVNAADVCWDNDRLANPVEVAFTKGETSPVFGNNFSCSAQLAGLICGVAAPVLPKNRRLCKGLIFCVFLSPCFEIRAESPLFQHPIQQKIPVPVD